MYSRFVNSSADLLQHHTTRALNTRWTTIPTTVQRPVSAKLVNSQRNHAWPFLANQNGWQRGLEPRFWEILTFSLLTHQMKEDGDPLPLLSGCCRRCLFPEKGFPIVWLRVMLSFGVTTCLFLLSVAAPRIVPLMESFYIFLVLAMLFHFLLESQEFLMTLLSLEYHSEPKFCSVIKKDWPPFIVLLITSSRPLLIL